MTDRWVQIARVGEIPPGRSKKFRLPTDDGEVECFLVHWHGDHYAYVNQCRHIALEMDWVENRFFDRDGEFLLCPTHGALYQPDTGECVFGPPAGKALFRIPLEVRGDGIFARRPGRPEES